MAQSVQIKTSPNGKSNLDQPPTVVQAWRNIFTRSSKSKIVPKAKVKRVKQGKPLEGSGHMTNDEDRDSLKGDEDRPTSASAASRLGKAELGRYAHEDSMPRSLRTLLNGHRESCNSGIIGVLSRLLKVDPSTKAAYLCDSRVQHVAKMIREGSFCGYRNLQMLISYIINAKGPGAHLFSDTYPTIFQLQDLIENAWDHGHNAHGRLETGGIKGTRKFIGTPEAQALFAGLGIKVSVQAFRNDQPGRAATLMLDSVYEYFKNKSDSEKDQGVHRTKAPPIYFQHQGHSLTIVGVQSKEDGGKALIVFDPAHRDTPMIKALVGTSTRRLPTTSARLLRPYRCSFRYLSKYKEFELLFLEPAPTS